MRKLRKIGKVRYYVDDKERIVQGFLETRESPFGWFMKIKRIKKAERFAIRDLSRLHGSEADFRRRNFSATARCSELDEFNEETGKRIVCLKLKMQWYAYLIQRIRRICKNTSRLIAILRAQAVMYRDEYEGLLAELEKYDEERGGV